MPAPNVPLARSIILGTQGQDVIAVKRAFSRAGYIKWGRFTNVAGEYFIKVVHTFQKKHGLKAAGYGPHTHALLTKTRKKGSKTEWAWDAYSIGLEHSEYVLLHTTPEQRIRQAIMQAARNLYSHRYAIAYSQARPFALYSMGGRVPTHLDCSGFVTTCYYAAHAKNPNRGFAYDGEGYTGTLMNGGRRVPSHSQLKAGDLIFYGYTTRSSPAFPYGSPTHVALYAGDGTVYSNGHYPMGHYAVYYGQSINCYMTYDVTP